MFKLEAANNEMVKVVVNCSLEASQIVPIGGPEILAARGELDDGAYSRHVHSAHRLSEGNKCRGTEKNKNGQDCAIELVRDHTFRPGMWTTTPNSRSLAAAGPRWGGPMLVK